MLERETVNISEIMIRDHLRLLTLLHRTGVSQNQSDIALDHLKKIIWDVEKHFFTEEKAIFSYLNSKIDNYSKIYKEIIQHHSEILDDLYSAVKSLQHDAAFSDFLIREKMINHQKYEENEVYPLLENEISDESKREIIDKIDDLI
jgi:hypothetical protein